MPKTIHLQDKANAASGTLKIFDLNGNVIYSILLKAPNEIKIDLTQFKPFIYNVLIDNGIFGNKFVKL